MGCTHSRPSLEETERPLPSRPKPTNSLYYKYHARPRLSQRYQPAYNRLTATSKKKKKVPNNGWNSIESYWTISQKVRMQERPCSAGLRVVNASIGEGRPEGTEL